MTGTWRADAVAVEGGELAVGVAGAVSAPAVLAIHGTTASHRAFTALARRLPERRVIAPDLRGRGRSAQLPGPYGLRRHGGDLEAVLDAYGVARVTVVGHSLGAFAAVALAARAPSRVERLVLVDGGIPLALPEGRTIPEQIAVVLGPAAARLRSTFADREEYHAFWRAHPAVGRFWGPDLEDYADYDLVGEPGRMHAATREAAVLEDGAELYGPDWYRDALRGIRVPTVFLRAPRDLQDRDGGLYSPEAAADAPRLVPGLEIVEVGGVNHYTILFDGPGLDAVVAHLGEPATLPPETKESR